jgi:hypothetical protein
LLTASSFVRFHSSERIFTHPSHFFSGTKSTAFLY